MLKTKSFKINPLDLTTKSKQNLYDVIFGWNNAFHWWELETNVKFNFKWIGQESQGNARGDQVMDLLLGLVDKYQWEGKDILLEANFEWEDGKNE